MHSDPSTFPLLPPEMTLCSVFRNLSSLEAVLRALPANTQIAAEVGDLDKNRSHKPTDQSSARKRKREEVIQSVAAAIYKMAEMSSSPQLILIQEARSSLDSNIMGIENSTKLSSPATSLMEIEAKNPTIQSIQGNEFDPSYYETVNRQLLERRLQIVLRMI